MTERKTRDLCQTCWEERNGGEYAPDSIRYGVCSECGTTPCPTCHGTIEATTLVYRSLIADEDAVPLINMDAFYARYGGPCAICRVARDFHWPNPEQHAFVPVEDDRYRPGRVAARGPNYDPLARRGEPATDGCFDVRGPLAPHTHFDPATDPLRPQWAVDFTNEPGWVPTVTDDDGNCIEEH